MTPLYTLAVESPDGVTTYAIQTDNKVVAYGFLRHHDSEGSNVYLSIDDIHGTSPKLALEPGRLWQLTQDRVYKALETP